MAVNAATNKIYVINFNPFSNGSVTVIDGATLSTTTVAVGNNPNAIAVNQATNRIYVTNFNDNTVSVIGYPTAPIRPESSR